MTSNFILYSVLHLQNMSFPNPNRPQPQLVRITEVLLYLEVNVPRTVSETYLVENAEGPSFPSIRDQISHLQFEVSE